jgi:hypothetical protein
MMMFRKLSVEEETEFRLWARQNYESGTPIDAGHHPVVQEECVAMNRESSTFIADHLQVVVVGD